MTRGAASLGVGIVLVTAGLLGAAAGPAEAFHEATLHVEGRVWFPSLSGEVQGSRTGAAGSLLSDDDLGLEDPDPSPYGAVTLRFGPHRLRADGFQLTSQGNRRVDRTITFDGRVFPADTQVLSELKVVVAGIEYGFDVMANETMALTLSLGGRFIQTETTLQAPQLGLAPQADYDAAVPALGVSIVAHPFRYLPLVSTLALIARIAGGTIGDQASFLDVEGGVEWLPVPMLAARAGYRFFRASGESQGDRMELTLSGPFLSVTLSF